MKLPQPQRVYRAHIATLGEVPRSLQFQKILAEAELNNLQTDFEILSKRFEEDIHFKIDQIYVGLNASESDFEKIYAIRLMIYNEYCTLDEKISTMGLKVHIFVIILNAIYIALLVVCSWLAIPDYTGKSNDTQDVFQFITTPSPSTKENLPNNQEFTITVIPNVVNDQDLYLLVRLRNIASLSIIWYTFFFALTYFIPGRKEWVLFNFRIFHFRLQRRSIIYLVLIGTSMMFGLTASRLVNEVYFKLVNGLVPAISERVVRLMNVTEENS